MLDMAAQIIGIGKAGSEAFKAFTEAYKNIKNASSSGNGEQKKLLDSTLETLRDKVSELQQAHFEMQALALSLSEQNMTLFQKVRSAEDELEELKKFDASRENFERVSLALDTFAYREKTLQGSVGSQPLFCPNCFDRSIKTYLSFKEHALHSNAMECSECSTIVHIPRDEGQSVMSAKVRRSRNWDF